MQVVISTSYQLPFYLRKNYIFNMPRYKKCYFPKCISLLGSKEIQEACDHCLFKIKRELKFMEMAAYRFRMFGYDRPQIKTKVRRYTRNYLA